jgi:SAM-dependent methyltransferase
MLLKNSSFWNSLDQRPVCASSTWAVVMPCWRSASHSVVRALPFADGSFDMVLAVTVLCFVDDAARGVREMARVLRPGGRLVIGELGRWNLWAVRRRVGGWLGSRVWRSATFRTARALKGLMKGAGLDVTAVRGAIYYPPYASIAALLAHCDPWIGKRTTAGAAFLVVVGEKAA